MIEESILNLRRQNKSFDDATEPGYKVDVRDSSLASPAGGNLPAARDNFFAPQSGGAIGWQLTLPSAAV
jgi:hypothetical protein